MSETQIDLPPDQYQEVKPPTEAEQVAAELNARFQIVSALIMREVNRAFNLHGPILNAHHALGVITEEYDEYLDEVRANNVEGQVEELVQIGAMAIRTLVDTMNRDVLGVAELKAKAEDARDAAEKAQAQARAARAS